MGSILHRETCIFVFALICSFAKKCDKKFDLHVDKIILSESSEKNGAVFLKKIVPQSSEECYKTCCESDQCTAAVYTSKRGKECYLFNCGDPNVCNFTSHADYSVFVLQQPIKHPARTSDSATTALSSATNSQPKGTLHGRCGPTISCTDENTICDSGLCVCQAGWIEKMHTCVRSVCKKPDLQFQCNDGSACIAVYDVCNGIAECRDESDEIACDEAKDLRKYTSTAGDRRPMTHKPAENNSHPDLVPKVDHLYSRLIHSLYHQRKQEQSQPPPDGEMAAAPTVVPAARPRDFLYTLDANDLEGELHSLRTGGSHQNPGSGGGGGDSRSNLAAHTTYEDLLSRTRRPVAVWQLDDPPAEADSDTSPFLMRLVDGSSKDRRHRLEHLLGTYGSAPGLLGRQRHPSLAAAVATMPKEEEEEAVVVPPSSRHRRLLRPPPPAVFTAPPKYRGFRLHPLLERYTRARFFSPPEEEEPAVVEEEREQTLAEPLTVLPRNQLSRRRTPLSYRGGARRRGHGAAFYEENGPVTKGGVRETEMSGTAAVRENTERAVESKSIADAGSVSFAAHNRTQWHIAAILLAIGLGIISCLFGFLVGRCRKDTCLGGGSRSKAVAASRLRRRIRDSRQAAAAAAGAGSDLEKNGLLTGLQL